MAPPRPPEQPQIGQIGASSETTLSEALATLRKRRLIVIVMFIVGLAYGVYTSMSQPRLFIATGRIEVRSGASNEYKVGAVASVGGDTSSRMLTEVTILTSDTLMFAVAKDLDLANNPDFLGAKGPIPHRDMNTPGVRQGTIGHLRSLVKVSQVSKTDIITISCSSLNAKLSADIVNKFIEDYKHRSFETRYESTKYVSEWLSTQLDDLKRQVETSQQQMIDLQKKLGILALDPNHSEISTSLEALDSAATQARIARILAESRYRQLNGLDSDTMGGTIDTTPGTTQFELNQLRSQLATERATLAQLTAPPNGLGPNNPTVTSTKARIDELNRSLTAEQNRMLSQAREGYNAALANERQTTSALDGQRSDAYKLRDDLVAYTLRQREFESNRTLYEGLEDKLRTAGVEAGLESMDIEIVDSAVPPVSPTLEPTSTMVLTRSLFGLLIGIVLAFLLESLDTGLSGIAEIEQVTELPSLAIVPRSRRMTPEQGRALSPAQRNIAVLRMPKSQFAEAFRSLRTSLMLSNAGKPPKILLFTSATPSEGKTTTTTNLACILAQRETQVLLIDCDLRRPSVHHRFGLNGKVGLTTVLTGATSLEEAVHHIPDVPNLDVLPSGPIPPFPTEMLSSEAMNALLERCSGLYTHIVLDSPPVLSVTDGVIMARHADAVVLVVRHGKSSKHIVRRAKDLLQRAGAKMTGVVLNAVDLNSPEYYGYYGYSGYSYSSIDSESWETTNAPNEQRKSKEKE